MAVEVADLNSESFEEPVSPWDNDAVDVAKLDLENVRAEIADNLLRQVKNQEYVDYDYPAIFLGLYYQSANHIDTILGKLIGEGKLIRTGRGWAVPSSPEKRRVKS